MMTTRRRFLGMTGASALGVIGTPAEAEGAATDRTDEGYGVLVDVTRCIGCRSCEGACARANGLPAPPRAEDGSAPCQPRRPDADHFTVVNGYARDCVDEADARARCYVKVQCMHCQDPACVSACIVAALTKEANGAVAYDADRCIGCRYCMVACPFEVPAYEYADPITPRVRKCTLCEGRGEGDDPDPACAGVCPTEALVFGRRRALLDLARARLEATPARYRPGIYGEHEVGGTSWLYLMAQDPSSIGLLDLPREAPARLTEAIQHGIFRYGAAPVLFYGSLGGLMWWTRRRDARAEAGARGEDER
jgi:formate dehydrogenase iron-sulfur subunit